MFDSTRLRAITFTIVALLPVQLACSSAGGDRTPTVTDPPPSAPTTGTLVVMVQAKGNGRDADGFSATADTAPARALTSDVPITFDSLSPGDHTVRITGIAPQCSASADSVTHTVKVGVTDTITVGMTCLGGIAYEHAVDSSTSQLAYLAEDGRTIELTNGPGFKYMGPWSPDGTRLLYEQYVSGHFHIYSVRADGTDPKTLTSGTGNEYSPRWSPDGAHIAYTQGDSTGIYVAIADADGANAHALAGASSLDLDVTWSADGSRLYFGCDRFGRSHDLCTAALDGSDLRAIRSPALDSLETPCSPQCDGLLMEFAASPDGSRIAFLEFSAVGATPVERIFTTSLDGATVIPLSGNVTSFLGLWSPTGDRMLLTITGDLVNYGLATVNRDGSSYQQIVSYADSLAAGSWSPDGKVLAYLDLKKFQVGVMNADGSNRRLLTSGIAKYGSPSWNPKARAVGTLGADRARPSSIQVEKLPVLPRLRAEILRRSLHPRP